MNPHFRYQARRSLIRIGNRLAVDFANTSFAPGDPAGALACWGDLVDFLELREAVSRVEGERLREMGESDARGCAAAFAQALEFRDTVRSLLEAMTTRKRLKAAWIDEINRALSWGGGADRLLRYEAGWRLGFAAERAEPFRALAPIARSLAQLVVEGPAAPIRKCANPRCALYFYDISPTRRRRWCSMAVCGNRLKVAAHARRRRGTP